jgi:glyoxylase-like metal-dependent hydrolase (beta-lactamase superfamily II)
MTRTRILIALLAIFAVLVVGGLIARRARYSLTVNKVSDDLYVFVGSGMNSTALITDEGVVLVDTMQDGWWGPALEATLQSITDKPITTIINTNANAPHSGNNFRFGKGAVEIVSHEATKSRLQRSERFEGANARHLPNTTFRDRLSLVRGKERIELYYFGPANTDGDAWVVFPSRRVLHISDIVIKNEVPQYVRDFGGSGVSHPETLARGMAALKDIDTVIIGHAKDDDPLPTLTWAELDVHRRRSDTLLAAVRKAMKSATTVEEVAVAVRSSDAFKAYDAKRVSDAVAAIYSELAVGRHRAITFRRGPDLFQPLSFAR